MSGWRLIFISFKLVSEILYFSFAMFGSKYCCNGLIKFNGLLLVTRRYLWVDFGDRYVTPKALGHLHVILWREVIMTVRGFR